MGMFPLLVASLVLISVGWALVYCARFLGRICQGEECVSFTPVSEADLPRGAAKYFAGRTQAVAGCGFSRVGDYRLKQRTGQYARVFHSADGTVFAELSWARILPLAGMRCCSFSTIFDDGAYLESGDIGGVPRHDGELFFTRSLKGAPVDRLHAAHRRSVEQIERDRGCRAVVCQPDEFPVVCRHGLRLMYDKLVERGLAARNIYASLPAEQEGLPVGA